jgi:hypothetical protein
MSDIEIDRRTALALLAAGVAGSRLAVAQSHLHALRKAPPPHALQFFSPEEHELVTTLAELIIPADEHSPGARKAEVGRYVDLVLANSEAADQASWKQQMAAFEELSIRHGGKRFLDAGPKAQSEVLTVLAPEAAHPSQPAGQFFARLRTMTIFGYYSSEIGLLKELEYKGNQALAEFPGCAHA